MNCKNCGKQIGNPRATHCTDCALREYHDSMEKTFPWWKDRKITVEQVMHDLDHMRGHCDCDEL